MTGKSVTIVFENVAIAPPAAEAAKGCIDGQARTTAHGTESYSVLAIALPAALREPCEVRVGAAPLVVLMLVAKPQ
jgi:hypothetical protein